MIVRVQKDCLSLSFSLVDQDEEFLLFDLSSSSI